MMTKGEAAINTLGENANFDCALPQPVKLKTYAALLHFQSRELFTRCCAS